jgi:TonB-linked SusC/RagA family outer membrane protein
MTSSHGSWWLRRVRGALLLLAATAVHVGAQQTTITGLVTDSSTSRPVTDVRVFVVGTNLIATTNPEGRYTLRGVPAGPAEIRVIRLGYKEQKKPVTVVAGQTTTVDFSLALTVIKLETIVTTATGEQRSVEVGYTIPSLADVAARVPETPILNMSDLLVGKAPGVTVLPGAMTGTAGTIRLRGLNSLSLSNAPIWIVDGVRFNAGSVNVNTGGQDATLLSSLNTDEIENVEIVKGPAAATLYGTDAANGVIVVTTKKGTPGDTKWSWYTERGMIKDRGDYPDSYMIWGHTAAAPTVARRCELTQLATPLSTATGPGVPSCIRDSVTTFNPTEVDELSPLQTGDRSQYGLQVSGGTAAIRYFVSGEMEGETGPIRMPDIDRTRFRTSGIPLRDEWTEPEQLKRTSIRANVNAALNEKFDLGVTTMYVRTNQRFVQTDNNSWSIFYQTMMNPGFRGAGPSRNPLDVLGRELNGNTTHTLGDIFQNTVSEDIHRFVGSTNANWRPFSWLEGTAVMGIDLADRRDFDLCRFRECPPDPTDGAQLGSVSSAHNNNRNVSTKLSSTAVWQALDWANLRTTVGADYVHIGSDGTSSNSSELPPGGQSVGQGAVRSGNSTLPTATKTLGVYVQEAIALRDRLFITLAARSDKNSAFGVDYGRAFYPSASLSWVASDETFFPQVPGLNFLRLRLAYGAAGVNPGSTSALDTYTSTTVNIVEDDGTTSGDTPGLRASQIGNAAIKPETSTELETGFETRLFSDRVNLDLTYYRKKTKDALISQPLAPSSAASDLSILRNLGSIQNQGLEVSLNTTVLSSDRFGWDITLAGARTENKILSLGRDASGKPNPTIGTGSTRDSVGKPIDGLYLRKYTYKDANGDGYIVPSEVVVDNRFSFIGSQTPRTTISLTNSFDLFRGAFRIYSMFDYKGDFWVVDNNGNFLCTNNPAAAERSSPNASLESQAACVAARSGTPTTSYGHWDKADFVRFRELSVTYRVPQRLLGRVRADGASISLGGRNLALWTSWRGTDPEMNYSTGDTQSNLASSSPRTYYTLRFNLNY